MTGGSERRIVVARFRAVVCADEGQDLVEYALLLVLISLACFIGIQQLGTAINQKYLSVSASITP